MLLLTQKLKCKSLFTDRKAVISQGMLKCVGSSIFLKSKWGIGYRLRYHSFFIDFILYYILGLLLIYLVFAIMCFAHFFMALTLT